MTMLPVSAGTTGSKALSANQTSAKNVDETIAYLLDYVSKSDCTFIRNGESHTGVEASGHLNAKYNYFKSAIKSPEDFIQMVATKSTLTGKPYLVKTIDGTVISCADWLGKVLADYRRR